MRSFAVHVAALGGLALVMASAVPQDGADPRLLKRWVGRHDRRPLHLDFYGDTMLVVNDRLALGYQATPDSLMVYGDTSFSVSYWFSSDGRREWLLLRTMDGEVITMYPQSVLARPLHGRWRGSPIGSNETIDLYMARGGIARWRRLSGGGWIDGEWDRDTRLITFTWMPDSTQWVGRHDPGGSSLIFDSTWAESGVVILRRVFR